MTCQVPVHSSLFRCVLPACREGAKHSIPSTSCRMALLTLVLLGLYNCASQADIKEYFTIFLTSSRLMICLGVRHIKQACDMPGCKAHRRCFTRFPSCYEGMMIYRPNTNILCLCTHIYMNLLARPTSQKCNLYKLAKRVQKCFFYAISKW